MKLFNAVEIEINSQCNMACSYCPNSVTERVEKGHMPKELYENLIEQLVELNFNGRISYDFYNEPTLSPNLLYFVELTKNKLPRCQIELYSNGTKIDGILFEALSKAGVDKFIITKHENITHYLFDETYSALSEEKKKKVVFRRYDEITLTNRGGMMDHIHGKISTTLLPCHIPMMMLTISNKGNVIPCFEDFYQANSMGNILDSSLLSIWNSDKYTTFRKKLSQGQRHNFKACKDCSRTEVMAEQ